MAKIEGDELPIVSIVIPTYNRKDKVERLIKSILISNYPKDKLEIIVIDDASSDNTYFHIKNKFPFVKVIRNSTQKLLAESRNIGIKESKGKYIFIIDDDNIVGKETIRILVEFLEKNPHVGVAAPIMYFLSDPSRVWCAGIKRSYWTTITRYVGFNKKCYNATYTYESDDFPNAFMIRREVIEKVGLFDSNLFPIHYDEGDFCQRVKMAGYKVVLVPTARIWHDIPLPEQCKVWVERLRNPLRAYYAVRNRILFHIKWSKNAFQIYFSILCSIVITLYYLIIVLLRISDKNKTHIIRSLTKGLIDGFKLAKKAILSKYANTL